MSKHTIQGTETAVEQILLAAANNARYLMVVKESQPKYGTLLNEEGTIIGEAHRIYRDGWAVHMEFFAGYVPDKHVVVLSEP